MWYFTWILGVALAVVFAAMSALWFENKPIISIMTGTKSRLPHIMACGVC